jgi:hypothetical protein
MGASKVSKIPSVVNDFFKLSLFPSNFLFILTQGLFIETRKFFLFELGDENRLAEQESKKPC